MSRLRVVLRGLRAFVGDGNGVGCLLETLISGQAFSVCLRALVVFACMSVNRRIPALANDRFDLASFSTSLIVLNQYSLLFITSGF